MKNTLHVILLLLIIILSGCEFLGYDEEISKIINSGNSKDCAKLEAEDAKATQTRIEKCYDAYAQKHEEPELCKKITTKTKYDDCYEDLAEKMERLDLCKELKGNSNNCISKVGIAKNDETICAQLEKSTAKDKCNEEIAINKNSIEICELVSSTRYKDSCMLHIAIENQDISICDKISRYGKNSCIQQLAVSLEDESLCNESSEKERCIKNVKTATEDDSDNNENLGELDEMNLNELEDDKSEYGVHEIDGKLYINSAPGKTLKLTSKDLPSWAYSQMVVVGALCTCVGPQNTIATGDSSILLNGLPVARINDKTAHGGTIVVGSSKIFINGVAAAFVGGNTVCPMVTGTVPHVGGPIINNGY